MRLAPAPLQLPDGGFVVRGRPPVLAIPLEERDDVVVRDPFVAPPLILIDQDRGVPGRDQRAF